MDNLKGFDYTVDVKGGVKEYAEIVLILTNLKSSRKETIEHIKTIEGTNLISVISQIDLDDFFRMHDAEITNKEEIEIIQLNFCDVNNSIQKQLEKLDDKDVLYFVELDKDDFMFGR